MYYGTKKPELQCVPLIWVSGYMVFPAIRGIFGWTRTKWAFLQYNILEIWCEITEIPDIWFIFETVEANFEHNRYFLGHQAYGYLSQGPSVVQQM